MTTWKDILQKDDSKISVRLRRVVARLNSSKAFHRLAGKTQIFLSGSHDHVQNRLTHTLTVANLSKFIANQLCSFAAHEGSFQNNQIANEIFVEAMAIAHDLGHTPFGHAGERVLNKITNGCYDFINRQSISSGAFGKGFKHNYHSARICTELEYFTDEFLVKPAGDWARQFLYGVVNHSKLKWDDCPKWSSEGRCIEADKTNDCNYSLSQYDSLAYLLDSRYYSIEAEILAVSDEIAQRQHDLLDAYIMNLLSYSDIRSIIRTSWKGEKAERDKVLDTSERDYRGVLALAVNLTEYYLKDAIRTSIKNLRTRASQLNNTPEISFAGGSKPMIVHLSDSLEGTDKSLKRKLKEIVLSSHKVQRLDGIAEYIIIKIYQAYLDNPMQLHDPTIITIMNMFNKTNGLKTRYRYADKLSVGKARIAMKRAWSDNDMHNAIRPILIRGIADHIAGMTDSFARCEYLQLYGVSDLSHL